MFVSRLELTNFRNYARLGLDLAEGVTAIIGANGQGKTSLTEALSYLATLKSFRGVPTEAMIRTGSDSAIIRATVIHPDGREILVARGTRRVPRITHGEGGRQPITREVMVSHDHIDPVVHQLADSLMGTRAAITGDHQRGTGRPRGGYTRGAEIVTIHESIGHERHHMLGAEMTQHACEQRGG